MKLKFRTWMGDQMLQPLGGEFKVAWLDSDQNPRMANAHPIMQYIGYEDKNKKEMYVGDIFKAETRIYKEDKWRPFKRLFYIEDIREIWMKDDEDIRREVIGNIYENPELVDKLISWDKLEVKKILNES